MLCLRFTIAFFFLAGSSFEPYSHDFRFALQIFVESSCRREQIPEHSNDLSFGLRILHLGFFWISFQSVIIDLALAIKLPTLLKYPPSMPCLIPLFPSLTNIPNFAGSFLRKTSSLRQVSESSIHTLLSRQKPSHLRNHQIASSMSLHLEANDPAASTHLTITLTFTQRNKSTVS
jgi:hypothetical protein